MDQLEIGTTDYIVYNFYATFHTRSVSFECISTVIIEGSSCHINKYNDERFSFVLICLMDGNTTSEIFGNNMAISWPYFSLQYNYVRCICDSSGRLLGNYISYVRPYIWFNCHYKIKDFCRRIIGIMSAKEPITDRSSWNSSVKSC